MSEKIPKLNEQPKIPEKHRDQFSYWAMKIDGSIREVSGRKKSLELIKSKGFESFEDFKIHNISIELMVKGSRQRKDNWENYSMAGFSEGKKVLTITGQIGLSGPLFGDKPKNYHWEAALTEDSAGPNTSLFGYELHLVGKKNKEATYIGAEDIISEIEANIVANKMNVSFPNSRSPGQAALREALPKIFKELKKYIWENCAPGEAINPEIANLRFKIESDISSEVDKDKERELVTGLKNHKFDEKIFYYGEGAEKFLEILKSPEYKLANIELELIKKHLPELAPYLQGRTLYDLGAANALKAQPLLEEQLKTGDKVKYVSVDIHPAMTFAAAAQINDPLVEIQGKILDFSQPLKNKLAKEPKLLALLGSTLGNGDKIWQQNLLRNLAEAMTTEDYLLVGVNLKEDLAKALKMYDNPAARNFVMTTVVNLGFPADKVELEVSADEETRQIKQIIHIKEDLTVKRGKEEIKFKQGEAVTIFVSQKYEVGELANLAKGAGLEIEKTFMDNDKQFELAVLRKSF